MANNNRKPDLAVGYRATTKKDEPYFKLILDMEEISKVVGDAKKLTLIGFSNKFKTADKHPDVIFMLPKRQSKQATGGKLPF